MGGQVVPQSAADEPPVTTNAEIRGWYMYDFANGAYFYTAFNLLPVLIQGQAAEIAKRTWCDENRASQELSDLCMKDGDWAKDYENDGTCYGADTGDWAGCGAIDTYTNTTCEAEVKDGWAPEWREDAIFVNLFGMRVGYASVTFICTIISVFIQIFFFLTFGALADYGNLRKKLFMMSNTVGSIGVILVLLGTEDTQYQYNAAMWILANVFFTFSYIFYNAYLPLLTMSHPKIVELKGQDIDEDTMLAKIDSVSSEISNKGLSVGFIGSLLNLFLSMGILFSNEDGGDGIRLVSAFSGLWALGFGAYSFTNLKPRPGRPLPEGATYMGTSWDNLKNILGMRHELPQLFRFLYAYFIFSDGVSTMTGAASLFAAIELRMSTFSILAGIVLVLFTSIASCVIWFKIEKKYNKKPKDILVMNIVILGLLPIYAFFGLKCRVEFYLLCLVFGLNFGAYVAYTRTVFSTNIPRGHEAEFFSLFEITDKGSAWLGPLLISVIFDSTGSFRASFFSLTGFLIIGGGILHTFDDKQAKKELFAFEKKERDAKTAAAGGAKTAELA